MNVAGFQNPPQSVKGSRMQEDPSALVHIIIRSVIGVPIITHNPHALALLDLEDAVSAWLGVQD